MELCEKVWDPKLIQSSGDDKKFDFNLSRRFQRGGSEEPADVQTLLLLLLQLVFDLLRFVVLDQPQDLFVVHHALDEFPL